ncbi:MAG: hypothetical protein LBU58_08670, partial [Clostridiales bacterium]|nr:hypothetical protein [Clostridiales bacterium]
AALEKVTSRYELADIFSGMERDYRPDLPVLNREAVRLYERLLGLEGDTFGMSLAQKTAALGLADILRPASPGAQLTRERAAALLARLYAGLNGLGGESVAASKKTAVGDEAAIDGAFREAVGLCLEKGFLKLAGGRFEPARALTRGELIAALAQML